MKDTQSKPPRTTTAADIAVTLLIGAVGIGLAILTILSVPRWWNTKFEFPPPMFVTFGLGFAAYMALYITRLRLPLVPPAVWDRPQIGSAGNGQVVVYEGNLSHRPLLRRLGGQRSWVALGCWWFPAPDEPALARVLSDLRDAGAVFPADDYKGFTASDVFIALRERGLVSGNFYQTGDNGELRER